MRVEARIKERNLAARRGGETVCRGIWGSGGAAFAVGKIYFFEGRCAWSEGDIVCVFDGFEQSERPLFSPAGVIISARAVSSGLIGFLSRTGIPYLILKEPFSSEHAGKVALLDTERDILIIDPCIDTLNDYALTKKSPASVTAELLSAGSLSDSMIRGKKRGGALITPSFEKVDIFDMLLCAAERFCSLPLTVSLSVPIGRSDAFCDAVEAVFRAAVYGDFSVELSGYRSREDVSAALSYMHRVFCRLEQEGREFNGYLCRGLLIDAPIWLTRPSPFPKADFICFDIDRLTSLLLGREILSADEADAAEEPLLAVWKNYFSKFAPDCAVRVKSKLLTSSELIRKWSELVRVDEFYLE